MFRNVFKFQLASLTELETLSTRNFLYNWYMLKAAELRLEYATTTSKNQHDRVNEVQL